MLDLFSGCGGLSLGFSAAGFKIAAAIENDPTAAASYGANFHTDDPRHAADRDIVSTTPTQLVRTLKLGKVAEAFDVIVGGPPCQAFARVGRSKLREIEAHPEAFRRDPRATLYTPYLRYVKSCRPLAILMENVPDVMNFGGHNVPEEVCEVLEELGYVCAYTLLNAAFYGVPQTRERMFLIAYHHEVAQHVSFPAPTHWVELPRGYEGSRRVALKVLFNDELFAEVNNYLNPPEASDDLPRAVTAKEAIGDLPEINARTLMRKGVLKRGVRRFDNPVPYDRNRSVSDYAQLVRDRKPRMAGRVGARRTRVRSALASTNPQENAPLSIERRKEAGKALRSSGRFQQWHEFHKMRQLLSYWRRGRDSNPRYARRTTVFETAPFNHSGTSP